GKTIVGAYLIGTRGTARHAVFLGLVVTATHTIGVYLLGLVMLIARASVMPERLFPWISVASGLVVLAVGVSLATSRAKAAFAGRSSACRSTDASHVSRPSRARSSSPRRGSRSSPRRSSGSGCGCDGREPARHPVVRLRPRPQARARRRPPGRRLDDREPAPEHLGVGSRRCTLGPRSHGRTPRRVRGRDRPGFPH